MQEFNAPLLTSDNYACRAMFSLDQSFPLAGAFAFSVYKFQQKRVKRDPEGPYFAGNPIVGALLSTLINLALACGVRALYAHMAMQTAASSFARQVHMAAHAPCSQHGNANMAMQTDRPKAWEPLPWQCYAHVWHRMYVHT